MKNNIRPISGNWDAGFVLDKHTISSTFLGYDANGYPQFDTIRSEVGEALYQLKYKNDFSKVEPLGNEIALNLVPKFGPIGMIIPMPATNQRARQPVTELAQFLSKKLDTPSFENFLTKHVENGAPQVKDLATKEEKVAALSSRFKIEQIITNDGKWNALLIDDLFDSGASMEAATAKLREYPKIGQIYVAALTWK